MNLRLQAEACKCPERLRGPTCGSMTAAQPGDVPGCCGVARASVPTFDTPEGVAVWSVPPVDDPALRACLARVPWVHGDQRNAITLRLVGQESPQLVEAPTVVCAALRPSNRCPIADARQVFDGNSTSGVFGLPHDSLADPVVEIAGKPRLLEPARPQQALGRFGSLFLELAAKARVPFAKVGVVRAAERLSIAVGSDVLPPEIDAQVFGRVAFRHVANVDGHVEEEHAIAVDQVCLPAHPVQLGVLIGAADPRHDGAAVHRPDRDTIRPLPRQDALVIDDGTVRPERRLDRLVPLVDLYHLGDGADGHLCRQAEVATNIVVGQFLKLNLASALVVERDGCKLIARRVELLHRRQHGRRLLGRRQHLELHRQLHREFYMRTAQWRQHRIARCAVGAIPPGLKAGASRAGLGVKTAPTHTPKMTQRPRQVPTTMRHQPLAT